MVLFLQIIDGVARLPGVALAAGDPHGDERAARPRRSDRDPQPSLADRVESRTSILFAASCLLYLVAPLAIVRYIVKRRVIDAETLLGAVAAYLLIGMFFAFAYLWLGAVQSGPFFGAQGDGTLADDLFFSFTTMTTIGFGSLVPAGNPGQSFAVAEGVIGQLFLVVAVAKIVGSWMPKRMDAEPRRNR